MKIKKININNYRSLVDFNMEFGDTTVLFGDNNVGKSNVLKALYTIFSRKSKFVEDGGLSAPENFYEGVIQNFANCFYKRDYNNTITFEATLSAFPKELAFDNPIKSHAVADTTEYVFEFKGKIIPTLITSDIGEIILEEVKLNDKVIFQRDVQANTIAYFQSIDTKLTNQGTYAQAFTKLINPFNDCIDIISSERGISKAYFPKSDTITSATNVTSGNFKNFLYNLYLDNSTHHIFEEINHIFNSEPFKFGEISFANDNTYLEIMIKNNGLRLPITDFGSSVHQTLFIISYIVYMRSKIICIEELEQNLSPKLQSLTLRMIQSMLKNSHGLNQIILSSHSSVYFNNKFGTVYYLEKDKNVTKAIKEQLVTKLGKEKISTKINEHFAPTQLPYDDTQFAEVKKMVETYHDLK